MLTKKKKKKKERNMLCVYLYAESPITPLPRLVSGSGLWIIIIITQVGKSFRTANLPRVLGHLQLEIPGQLNELLMLLHSGLKIEKKTVLE